MMAALPTQVDYVLVGKAVPLRGDERSAIRKTPVAGLVRLGWLGFEGDEQADHSVHGGPEKAVHHYPFDHYALWRSMMPEHQLLSAPGAFGENISTLGCTEETMCIGDRVRIGTALVEISQPRQPCWKQGHVMTWPKLPRQMVKAGKTGWYYRVIEEGALAAGDGMTLEARPHPEWTVARCFALLLRGEGESDPQACRALASLGVLETGWRAMARRLGER